MGTGSSLGAARCPIAMAKSKNPFAGCPEDWADLIDEAEKRGYLERNGAKITYRCAAPRDENWDDPEEKVRAAVYAWLILDREYPAEAIKVEVNVPRRTPNDRADIVVYTDTECRTPWLVVETKEPATTKAEFKQAIEQGFGNANSLRDTHCLLVDSGRMSEYYQVAGFPHDERRDNRFGPREHLPKSYAEASQFAFIAGDAANDIKPPKVNEAENLVRRAHALIWAGGKRDPLDAFDQWCKLLFAKIYDERHTENGEPRKFQVGRKEQDVACANRIRNLYADARNEDPSIFISDLDLPDDKIAQVVRTIQGVSFMQMDIDSLGAAFEGFFGSIFRGELGQYFTRRELCRFVCALLRPTDKDRVLDPTAGSGGFLLETLIQVWHHIEDSYGGQPEQERRKYDFAKNNLFGIEINAVLGRICQTNLMLHKDGHTNVVGDRSCLDNTFGHAVLDRDATDFTLVVGNPPFGDDVKEGSRDHLGTNKLSTFDLPGGNQIASEIVILERSIKWLRNGTGRLGMVVPDGMLNNSSETSRCPALRRYLFRYTQVLAIVSLPDHAFRKSGAQNKTSVLFLRRRSKAEQKTFDAALAKNRNPAISNEVDREDHALAATLKQLDYQVFLAEADEIGFTPSGVQSDRNDLYARNGLRADAAADTILGQYRDFEKNPDAYAGTATPPCMSIAASGIYANHATHRIDPKYHIFKHVEEKKPPAGVTVHMLDDLLERRQEGIVPNDLPDVEFRTITLTQEGELEPREAGKGNSPPDWHGAYFKEGQKWFLVREGDILISRIDLWKGCIGVVSKAFDGAVVTLEFPSYFVKPEKADIVVPAYLRLLLRTAYFQRAIRAITTGHSNRRRTQEEDFLALKVPLPDKAIQERIATAIEKIDVSLQNGRAERQQKLAMLDELLVSEISAKKLDKLLA